MAISFGWPLVCMMSFIVALSMAEICSGARLAMQVSTHVHAVCHSGRALTLTATNSTPESGPETRFRVPRSLRPGRGFMPRWLVQSLKLCRH